MPKGIHRLHGCSAPLPTLKPSTLTTICAMAGIHSTEENLKEAINGENHEAVSMYPPFLETAKAEGDTRAARSFEYALEVEKSMLRCTVLPWRTWARKPGNTITTSAPSAVIRMPAPPDKCPVCGLPGAKFEVVH